MKILHLGKFCPPIEGGTETFTIDLLKALNNKNIKADLVCFGKNTFSDKFLNFILHSCKTNIILASAPISIDFLKTLKEIVKNYDILHVHSPNPLAEMATLFFKKKVIIHWHMDIVRQKFLYKFYKPIQYAVLQRATKIIATSPNYLESSEQLRPFIKKTVVVPLGIDFERLEDELGHPNNDDDKKNQNQIKNIGSKKIVLSIGRLVSYKGFEYLVEAGRYLDRNISIVIVGRGPQYPKLKKMIEKMKLQDRVFLVGWVEKIAPFIKNCDVFCLPSVTRSEAFGVVLLEAMYFGKPLITTRVLGSGMNFVNIEGETGLVVPPRDPKALADAIAKLLSDRELYIRLSAGSKERIKSFDINIVAEKVINLYRDILG